MPCPIYPVQVPPRTRLFGTWILRACFSSHDAMFWLVDPRQATLCVDLGSVLGVGVVEPRHDMALGRPRAYRRVTGAHLDAEGEGVLG